jgi:hypothetical protein
MPAITCAHRESEAKGRRLLFGCGDRWPCRSAVVASELSKLKYRAGRRSPYRRSHGSLGQVSVLGGVWRAHLHDGSRSFVSVTRPCPHPESQCPRWSETSGADTGTMLSLPSVFRPRPGLAVALKFMPMGFPRQRTCVPCPGRSALLLVTATTACNRDYHRLASLQSERCFGQ